jgi:flagellin
MAAFINTNISSLNAQRNLNSSQGALATSLQRLSSGLRINSAKDDAAGLAISERMTSQIRGSDVAARNANDGISLAQTAEGDLVQIGNNLQRMRELSVQAANATNSASDRAALNSEFKALSEEIDRVAKNSSFNGVNLLDGSFTSQAFQVGANASSNDQITIDSITSARTSALGGVGTSYAATQTSGKTTAALAAGDLTLNGSQVGASVPGALPGQSAASAFSIAKAINGVSASSGVTATADANTLTATATNFGSVAANSFSINGINVGAIAAGTTAAGQGANVAAAINAISSQSGVSAAADATTGAVTLTAADGRDISIASAYGDNVSATATALNTTLSSKIGFAVGTGATATAGTAAVASTALAAAGTYTVSATQGKIAANTIAITTGAGTYALGEVDLSGTANENAARLSAAINAATGAATTTVATNVITAGAGGFTVSMLGIAADTATATANTNTAIAQFGTPSAAGVIGKQAFTPSAHVDAVASTTHGTISLSSTSADGIVWAGAAATSAGLAASGTKTATVTSSVSSIDSVNVLTADSASKALKAIDGALETINSSRASLGAYQNRFASVVSSLQTSSENLSASRSRIQDTDFAKETAQLTRGQILQQAGTAMLAQANSLPNGVLALLRG